MDIGAVIDMDIGAVIDGVREALSNPRAGRKWVQQFISGMSPQDLKNAVATNFDPVTAMINEYSLADSNVRKMATLLIRRYWRDISDELRSVPKIVARLGKNPANREALKDPKVIEWLNTQVQRAYNVFFLYAWSPNIDLRCAHCRYVFPFDVLRCTQMQLEGKGKRIYVVLCPNCGREVQAVF
jgi:hypothetical protein